MEITRKGVLRIKFYFMGNCAVSHEEIYTFRYQNKRFELIGFENSQFHQLFDTENSISINYPTGRILTVTEEHLENDGPTRKWDKFKTSRKYDLQTINQTQRKAIGGF